MTKKRCTMIDKQMADKIELRQLKEMINKQVANNIKLMRLKEGKSQKDVGKAIGVSIQQVQKYEKGTNRISAPTLFVLSKFFKVALNKFY